MGRDFKPELTRIAIIMIVLLLVTCEVAPPAECHWHGGFKLSMGRAAGRGAHRAARGREGPGRPRRAVLRSGPARLGQ